MKKYYGWDSLSTFLAICSLPFMLSKYTIVLSLIIWLIILYRTFSTGTARRAYEKQTFLAKLTQLASLLIIKRPPSAEKNYRYFTCPSCKANLRVPRGKGKIMLTCSVCGHKFQKKT